MAARLDIEGHAFGPAAGRAGRYVADMAAVHRDAERPAVGAAQILHADAVEAFRLLAGQRHDIVRVTAFDSKARQSEDTVGIAGKAVVDPPPVTHLGANQRRPVIVEGHPRRHGAAAGTAEPPLKQRAKVAAEHIARGVAVADLDDNDRFAALAVLQCQERFEEGRERSRLGGQRLRARVVTAAGAERYAGGERKSPDRQSQGQNEGQGKGSPAGPSAISHRRPPSVRTGTSRLRSRPTGAGPRVRCRGS